VVLMLAILARLTRRWEAVTRNVSHYRLFYLAGALVALASLARMVRIGHLYPYADSSQAPLWLLEPSRPRSWFYLLFYHLPLATATTLSLVVAWMNWGWLLRVDDR
jgi:hypothetical protein